MPGLNPRGFGQGFRQGFGLMSDYQAQQQQMELQRQQERRQQQQFEQQTELREQKMDKLQDERNRERAKIGLQQLATGEAPGEESLTAMNSLGIEPRKLVSGEYLDAADKLQQSLGAQSLEQGADLQGPSQQDQMLQEQTQGMQLGGQATEQALQSPQAQKRTAEALNDPNIIEAANTFLEGRIQRGVGEEVDLPEEAGGGKGQVLRKRIQGMTPMGGGTVGMDLEVAARNEDGEVVTYTAPATENRSGDPDDPVQGVPVDELMDHAAGLTQEAKAFQMDPQARENAKQKLYQMDPDMAPERKIVDLGARGKAVMTEGGGQFGMQPIPGTAERDSDLSSAGQQFRELVAQGTDPEEARAIAYGTADGESGYGQYDYDRRVGDLQGLSERSWGDELTDSGWTFPSEDAEQMANIEQSLGEQVMRQYPEVTPGMFHETFMEAANKRVTPEMARTRAQQEVEKTLQGKSTGEGWLSDGDIVPGDTVEGVTWKQNEPFADFKRRLVNTKAEKIQREQPDVQQRVLQRLRRRVDSTPADQQAEADRAGEQQEPQRGGGQQQGRNYPESGEVRLKDGGVLKHNGSQVSWEDVHTTAKKHDLSVDEVLQKLGAQ